MSSPALFQLVAEYRAAGEALAELDIDPQTLSDTLESLSGDLESKAQAVAYVSMNLSATANAIRAHAKAQLTRADAIEARCHALREYLARCMTDAGILKIEGPGVKLSFRKSSAVVIDGADLIPADLMRQAEAPPPAPDKSAIKLAIAAGRDVPGAHIEQRQTLQIA
jgi:hypothetical protein